MTTVPGSHARRGAFIGLVATLCAATGTGLSAHRRDEVLQAARVSVEPDRVRLEISLTPGIEIAEAFIREIDGDGDLRLSDDEQHAFVERVRSRLVLRIDDSIPLTLSLAGARFPEPGDLRSGEAAIALEMEAALTLGPGAHWLFFRNDSATAESVFLANALVPESDRVGVTGQERDFHQRQLTVLFELRERQFSRVAWAWLGFVCVLPLALRRHSKGWR